MRYIPDLDAEAEKFLSAYGYENAITIPMSVPIWDIANRMSLEVIQTECLSYDDSVQGAIAFSDGIMVMASRDDDDKNKDKDLIEKAKNNLPDTFIQNISTINKIPLLKDAFSIKDGWDINRMDLESLINLKLAWDKWGNLIEGKGKTTVYGATYSTLRALSQLSGLPISNAMREVEQVWNDTIARALPEYKLSKKK